MMRGLKDDSFLETQKEARRLQITYDINPDLFEEYAITRVPTIVVETSDASQKCAVFSQVMASARKPHQRSVPESLVFRDRPGDRWQP